MADGESSSENLTLPLSADVLAHERREHLPRAALLAAEDPLDRIRLLVRRPVVYDEALPEVAGPEGLRDEVREPHVHAREVQAVEVSLADAEDGDAVAEAVRGGGSLVERAAADLLAVAVPDVRSGNSVCHSASFPSPAGDCRH